MKLVIINAKHVKESLSSKFYRSVVSEIRQYYMVNIFHHRPGGFGPKLGGYVVQCFSHDLETTHCDCTSFRHVRRGSVQHVSRILWPLYEGELNLAAY